MARKIATREAYGRALVELGKANPNVVVLDADLSKSTKTAEFAREFPDRFFQAGIAEQNLVGLAAGLALGGKVAFASSFAVFATGRAFEQIRNSVAYARLNVKIAASHAGISVGEDGGSHQSVEDIALMRSVPEMTVLVPADAAETEQAVWRAAELAGPVYLRLGRMAVPAVHEEGFRLEIGRAYVLRPGEDAAVLACGLLVAEALTAAEIMAGRGVRVRVIDVPTVKPLDEQTILEAARQTGALVTAEEHSVIGGLGGAVAELLAEQCPVHLERVGLQDTFGESGHPEELLKKYGLSAEGIVAALERVLARKDRICR